MTGPGETTHPPLTAEDFNEGCGYTFHDVPLCEDENGEYVCAYGHVAEERFAAAGTALDAENGSWEATPSAAVQHKYAITLKPPNDPEGWWIRWYAIGPNTPGSFPLTVVDR